MTSHTALMRRPEKSILKSYRTSPRSGRNKNKRKWRSWCYSAVWWYKSNHLSLPTKPSLFRACWRWPWTTGHAKRSSQDRNFPYHRRLRNTTQIPSIIGVTSFPIDPHVRTKLSPATSSSWLRRSSGKRRHISSTQKTRSRLSDS